MHYFEIIFIRWTFNFVFFMGSAIHKFKFSPKRELTLVILRIIWNPQIQVSTNMPSLMVSWNFVPMNIEMISQLMPLTFVSK